MNGRAKEIQRRRAAGETYAAIGKALGISRQRVDQICNPQKHRARQIVGLCMKTGALARPSKCQGCGRTADLQAHHPDHGQPLEVEWLCRICHASGAGAGSVPRRYAEMGGRILGLRTAAGLSQSEAASAIGISRTYYSRLELGDANLSADVLSRIARALKTSMDHLYNGDGAA